MNKINLGPLRATQRSVAEHVSVEDSISLEEVKHIGAFAVTFTEQEAICGAVVMSWPEMEVLEKKSIKIPLPMKYIQGYEAFRAGPAILQLYYELEYDPELIFVEGTGIAHPVKAGLASYLGTELDKITIGVAKKVSYGDIEGNHIMMDGEERAILVQTKEHAKELIVSPGHQISIDSAAQWVKQTIVAPHKRPEPLHIASRLAKKASKGGDYNI